MTYKEIINRFRSVTEDHYMLQDFGYGQLSDLKTQSQLGPEEQGVDYPYLFLLPQAHTRQGPVMNYTFNMIVMDMARTEEGDVYDNYISIQSQCQQYIDDVLGQLYFRYKDQPEIQLTNIQYNAFKEKYQDELAGMTATITIQVPQPIDNCIAPFVPPSDLYVYATHLVEQLVGQDVGENKAFSFTNEIVNTDDTWDLNRWTVVQAGSYKIQINYTFQFVKNSPTDLFPLPPRLRYFPTGGGQEYIQSDILTGWPETPQEGVTYTVYQEWSNLDRLSGDFEFVYMEDQPGAEADLLVEAGKSIKIYKYV